ncbi:MAG: amino acid aminotransferase [Phototrophicales bacterium]|nr:MAG: amino acid aminotransferase [Phototrophicales bacterium]RMG72881.1 MAG: amino acid aminotransferase [Chloroflexota bacterium]
MVYYVDGQFVEADSAAIPLSDLGVIRGYGVFDFTRTYHRQPFYLDEHIARLFRSAALIDLEIPWSQAEIRDIVQQTLAHNPHLTEAYIRIIVTGGDGLDSITLAERPRLIVLVNPATPPSQSAYQQGEKVITVREQRYLPQAKTLNYIPAIRAMKQAHKAGAIDAIYVDPQGHVLEGTTTNIFAFFGETLITPNDNILDGITRMIVINLAQSVFDVQQRVLTLNDLYNADEVFITSSHKQILPIVQVDEHTIGNGIPGERTRRMMSLFAEHAGIALTP